MDKVVSFLEKYVQWVALGLGVLWLGFMAWSYVIVPPASVQGPEGKALVGGEIDKKTSDTVVRDLETKINNAQVPKIPVDNYAETFLATMDWKDAQPMMLAGGLMNSQTSNVQLPTLQTPLEGPTVPGTTPLPAGAPKIQIAGLPEIPTPVPADNRVGRSAVEPVVQLVPGQPVAPRPAILDLVDKDWVTQAFKVSIDEIEQAFKAVNIPMGPGGLQTFFLRVEIERQELSPEGEWGNETAIAPIDLGVPREKFPEGKVNRAQEQTFINWAQSNQPAILQPGFFIVGAGNPWAPPGEVAVAAGVFNPATFPPNGDLNKLAPEDKKAVFDYRREQYKQKQAQQRGTRQPRAPRGGAGEGLSPEEMMNAPRDKDRANFGQVRRRQPQNTGLSPEEMAAMEGLSPEEMMGMEGEMGMQPGMPNLPNAGVPGTDYPAGAFDPSTWVGADPITIYTHDDTIEAGKTYRYRISYTLKNPLFMAPAGLTKDPKLASTIGINSPKSEWGPAVSIPEKVQFFIASGIWGGVAKFDVFSWVDGVPQMKQFSAQPGDQIGRPDADADFTTPWTIVTLPTTRDDDRIVIVNGDGRMMSRSAGKDRSDPLYAKLKADAELAKEQNVASATPRR